MQRFARLTVLIAFWLLGDRLWCQVLQDLAAVEAWQRDIAIARGLPYVIEPPDVLGITIVFDMGREMRNYQISVRPDGKVDLGEYGRVYVAGMTVEKSKKAIEELISERADEPLVMVDVATTRSKKIFVIVKGGERGDSVAVVPWTNEGDVLRSLSASETVIGLEDRISAHRARRFDGKVGQLDVDLKAIVRGDMRTNFNLLPGDRIIVTQAHAPDQKEAERVLPMPILPEDGVYGPRR